MYGKLLSGKRALALAGAGTAICAIAGCGSTTAIRQAAGGHPPALTQAQVKAKAEAEVTNCVNIVGPKKINSSSGRTAMLNCLTGLVPRGKQKALKSCLSLAVKHDKTSTPSGRLAFESKDGADCVAAKTK